MNAKLLLISMRHCLVLALLLFTSGWALGQTGQVTGKVTDSQTGDLLPGATVMIKGTSLGTAADVDGRYLIPKAPAGEMTLVISSVGYQGKEITVNVTPGERVTADMGLAASSTQLADIVITGLRKSQIDAINRKKQALNTKEVLTTNDIGRLPDINVAEAAQRVSGVSIETDNGEGRFISIRGIQPALNNVTLNNTNIGSTAQGRETPLDLLPVEMISSIEVVKANTPDLEGNAIGGSININTISAFDKAQSEFLITSVDGLIQEQQAAYGDDKFPFRAAITAGKRFGENEKFGAVVSANFFRRDFTVSVLDPDRWQLLRGSDGPGIDPQGNPVLPGFLGPNEIEIQVEDNERDRYGLTADLEYRFTPNNSVYFRSLYTHNNERRINSEFELTILGLNIQNLTNQTPTTGQFSHGSGELDLSSSDDNEDLYSFTLGTEHRLGAFSFDLYGTYSRADQDFFSIDGTYENPLPTEDLLGATYDINPFFFDITAVNQQEARDPSLYVLRNLNFRRNNTVQENMYEASVDMRYDFTLGGNVPGYFKAGGRIRSREKTVDRSRDEYNDDEQNPFNGDNVRKVSNPYRLDQFNIDPIEPEQGGAQPNVHGDAEAFRNFFADPATLADTSRIVFRPFDTAEEIYDEDIYYSENVTAGYLMGVVDFDFMTLTAGVRVERTSVTSEPYTLVSEDETIPVQDRFEQLFFENSYTNVMPSINLKANPFDNFIARLSWTNTIGRPDYDVLSGTSQLDVVPDVAGGGTTGTFIGANPDLAPFESMNLDLALEYYFPSGGILSGGAFYKDIDNYIFDARSVQNNVEFRDIFFEELTFRQSLNLENAVLQGLEVSYDQAFTFLPGFFSGFGITANAAFIDSEVDYPDREGDDLPLLRQPNRVFNIIPYYQKYGLELRAAITYRSEFLVVPRSLDDGFVVEAVEAGFSVTDFDRYEGERTAVDLTAAYTFPSRKFKILAQARNLTNAPEQEYQGIPERYDRHQLFGASYFLGFTINL